MCSIIYLPKLNNLNPTIYSTILKAVEESGELARAVLKFTLIKKTSSELKQYFALLEDVASELLDVAQVCITMLFVMEEYYEINIRQLIKCHLIKLLAKGYLFAPTDVYEICNKKGFKSICLPKLAIKKINLLITVCKILEELGELSQFLGKKTGASGEIKENDKLIIIDESALELLDIAQCCFTMIYILEDKYNFDIMAIVEKHIYKMKYKGYYI